MKRTEEASDTTLRRLLREKTREAEILHQIAETVSGNLDLDCVLRDIMDIAVQVTKADSCLVYLLNSHKDELVLKASLNPHPKLIGRVRLGLGEGITGWVAQQGRTVAIASNASDDSRFKMFHNLPEDRHQAFLSVPLIVKHDIIGVINLQHKQPHRHRPHEVALMTTIGRQVGGAIETARLHAEVTRKARQVETLSEVSATITSGRLLDEILHLLVSMTAQMMGSTTCSIMLLDPERDELKIAATQSLSEMYRSKPNLKVGQSISGRVLKERRPIAVLDVTKDPDYMYSDLARKEGLCSLLSVPMLVKDKPIGVINSYTAHEHLFSQEERKVLQSVANQAAIAIENTSLMEKSFEMQEALAVRKTVERAKGVLMQSKRISEEEAFRLMQRQSMDTRRSMRDIAEAILLAGELDRRIGEKKP
ncbi:MAG: GAF domain-containing protein [Nitrospirae bacterium]|nr:MAG: GAF domain-containing protein [Nitrospirota bacterium]